GLRGSRPRATSPARTWRSHSIRPRLSSIRTVATSSRRAAREPRRPRRWSRSTRAGSTATRSSRSRMGSPRTTGPAGRSSRRPFPVESSSSETICSAPTSSASTAGSRTGPRPVRTMTRTRIAGIAGAVVLAGLAFQAGEYGTVDWLKLRRQLADERRAVRALEVELDSLARLARALETDPAAQERAAREQFGMIRKGEILYRLVPQVDPAPPLPR